MQTYYTQLYTTMEQELKELRSEDLPLLKRKVQSADICRTAIFKLREYLRDYQFNNKQEEIHFFKEVFPSFFSNFIYYVHTFSLEAARPAGSDKLQRKYLKAQFSQIRDFFNAHRELYQYYRTGATHLDEQFYTRATFNTILLNDELQLALDPETCTVQSYKLSKIKAFELLRNYIVNSLSHMEQTSDVSQIFNPGIKLRWTSSKVALIELIYSLHSAGVFNLAKTDIKQLTGYFETLFEIELGNVYHVFQEIRLRKKNRTSFLDQLRARLVQRMDETDEGY